MNIAKLIELLRRYNLFDKIYIQSGYNRFDIKEVTISDDGGIVIVIEDDANNPVPPPVINRRA